MTNDFRKIYGYSVFEVGKSVHWAEALMHLQVLKTTPESLLYVALSNGKVRRPWSWTEEGLYDLIDATRAAASSKKLKPIPRPWDSGTQRLGKASISLEAGIKFFGRLGHKPTIEKD